MSSFWTLYSPCRTLNIVQQLQTTCSKFALKSINVIKYPEKENVILLGYQKDKLQGKIIRDIGIPHSLYYLQTIMRSRLPKSFKLFHALEPLKNK